MINKEKICIVVPVYKDFLNNLELLAVERLFQIFYGYSVYFVAPNGLNIEFYINRFSKIENFIYFEKFYFSNINGYNKLMLEASFYKKFVQYEYMLIYQTDSYVFKDELIKWCSKNFDYIGGICFDNFIGDPNKGAGLAFAGNGGFSLRKIDPFIKLLSSTRPMKKSDELIKEIKNVFFKKKYSKLLLKIISFPFKLIGWRNNFKFSAKNYKLNEDFYFIEASIKYEMLKMPKVEEAILFSWDRCPDFLYSKYHCLPMACHAWYRQDFPYESNFSFWKKYINILDK